jgi:hypothetical protein
MRLLPDIMVESVVLSMQPPYTINGKLIKKCSRTVMCCFNFMNNNTSEKKVLKITNIDSENFVIKEELLIDKFNRSLNSYIFQYNNLYEDYNGSVKEIPYSNYDEYISKIKEQCDNCERYNCDNIHFDARILLNQNRITIADYESITNQSYYCSSSTRTEFINARNIDFTREITFESKPQKKYIHQFNYTPVYIPHYMPYESENTALLLGAEIEIAGNKHEKNREEVVKKCIQIMNGSDSDEEDLIYSTHDGTVQIELDTMPCSLEFHKNKMNYKEMFRYLDSLGYKGHDCDCAGLHIHANRSYLGKTTLLQQLTISKILYIIEKFNDQICVIARRNNDYSQFVGKGKLEDSVVELYGRYKSIGKRVALNLAHRDTIEFRMFKSTLKPETLLLTFEFVKDIIDFAKSINIEKIECIQWEDIMSTFSIELRKYYNTRLNKKNKKENDQKVDDEIQKIKDNISYLKKKLNHCSNFMEKKRLQSELNDAQKELAKYKRKKKNKEDNENASMSRRDIQRLEELSNFYSRTLPDYVGFDLGRGLDNAGTRERTVTATEIESISAVSAGNATHDTLSRLSERLQNRQNYSSTCTANYSSTFDGSSDVSLLVERVCAPYTSVGTF